MKYFPPKKRKAVKALIRELGLDLVSAETVVSNAWERDREGKVAFLSKSRLRLTGYLVRLVHPWSGDDSPSSIQSIVSIRSNGIGISPRSAVERFALEMPSLRAISPWLMPSSSILLRMYPRMSTLPISKTGVFSLSCLVLISSKLRNYLKSASDFSFSFTSNWL